MTSPCLPAHLACREDVLVALVTLPRAKNANRTGQWVEWKDILRVLPTWRAHEIDEALGRILAEGLAVEKSADDDVVARPYTRPDFVYRVADDAVLSEERAWQARFAYQAKTSALFDAAQRYDAQFDGTAAGEGGEA